ncbi:MAG: hypothetical protein H7Z11_02315 [Verrucomicrobia bacterium]|nr:hypothetical protein [Leptolyngbya sp. ES-bin-22]
MLNHIRWLTIAPQPLSEAIVAYALTRDFYREVEHRAEFEDYCDWYYQTAAANQAELQRMQGDINLFGWFNRRR